MKWLIEDCAQCIETKRVVRDNNVSVHDTLVDVRISLPGGGHDWIEGGNQRAVHDRQIVRYWNTIQTHVAHRPIITERGTKS